MAASEQKHLEISTVHSARHKRKQVIGIYGLPGCGKTYLLELLKQKLGGDRFAFFEGSQLIDSVVPGGLQAFHTLDEQEKAHWRRLAISKVVDSELVKEQAAVVTGHYMFWKETEDVGTPVVTQMDLQTYTHILYLDVPASTTMSRRQHDTSRKRPQESVTHLSKWQQAEKTDLRRLCYDHGILFSVVSGGPGLFDQVSLLLQDFQRHTETYNRSVARRELDDILSTGQDHQETLLVLDGDKTLTATDTGETFWNKVSDLWPSRGQNNPLKTVFSSKMSYSYAAFYQVMLLYEEIDDQEFNDVCEAVATTTTMYAEFISLLQAIGEQNNTKAVIVTCGLRRVWELILKRQGLFGKIKVIGGGRVAGGLVVTGDTKTDLVLHAKTVYGAYVCAFGDSPLDLGMLKEADRAVIIVGQQESRSKSMEKRLLHAIEKDGLRAYQAILPSTASPRLTPDKLPQIELTGQRLARDILRLQPQHTTLPVRHATNQNAAKLLMTPMRDASIAGPRLREAHRLAGHYLAIEFLSDIIGVEEYVTPHVLGHQVGGYRLLNEEATLIVALMRGGEPMAYGVNDALPRAMLLHANEAEDVRHEHVHGRLSVILVDSVVNSGETVLKFVQHIRHIHATIRIVVVAGVVQSDAVSRLAEDASCRSNFRLVALRLSDNKFTGRGGTDTGNRLFNTTHLD